MTDEFNVAMGGVIRELRRARGLSQTAVGKKISVTFQQVQKYERGTNGLAAHYVPKLAALLGVSVAELYDRAGVKNAYRPVEAA